MKRFSKLAQAGTMVAGLAVLPLMAQEPTTPAPNPDMTRTDDMHRTTDVDDDDFNFGWLGLLGLAGLAGMARKRPVYPDSVNTEHTRTDRGDINRDRL